MRGRRVPRAIVVTIATAIVCVPAITAFAYQYIRDGQSRVVHLHRGVYEVYNGINATTGMTASAGYAINNWGNQLADRDTVAVREVPGLTGTEVWFRDYDLPDAGAAVVWSETWHQTSLPINVVFDSTKESSWSQNLKQHKACNVIGNLLGLADSPGSGDCMDGTTDSPTASAASVDAVDDFYGPNVSFANQLYDNRTNLDSAVTYPLDVTASGHAIQSVTVTLDGNQIATKTITPCDGSCSVGVSPNIGPLSAGTHTIGAAATNEFGQSHLNSITLTVAPNTLIDSGPNGPTSNAMPTFTYHSPTTGTTFQCRVDQASFAACPASGYTPSAALSEGSHTFYVRANDSGHVDPTPASRTFTVDTVRPALNASGDFTDHTNPLVSADPLEDVTATDTGTGVTQAVLKIDGAEAETLEAFDNCDNPCSIDDTFFPELSDVAAGSHTFQIFATDAAGNNSVIRSGSFTLDPAPPQIVVTGPLADSSGGPLQSATADASIAATDSASGDSGVASIEVAVDDETDRTYDQTCAPTCPSSVPANYTYSKANWGAGPHLVAFFATDKAGNTQSTTLDVDEPSGDPVAGCPVPQADQQDPGVTVGATGAENQAIGPAVEPTTDPASDPDTGDELSPTLTPADDGSQSMESSSTVSVDEISQGPTPSIDVGDQLCLVPAQTTSADTPDVEATAAGGDVQVYPNTATYSDTIVRPTVGGEAVIESIRGSGAPDSFSFDVGIPPGDELQELSGGGLAVVNPSEAAPADLSVPPDPHAGDTPQQITNELPDATVQLAEQIYWVARAEQETGQIVDAVIQPPLIVDSAGDSTPSPLALSGNTITVDVPSGAKAVMLKAHSNARAPKLAPSWYVTAPRGNVRNQVSGFACTFANWDNGSLAGNRLFILNFNGVTQYSQKAFGTYNRDKLHNGLILKALKDAADEYHSSRCAGGGDVTIVYGNSNKNSTDVPTPDNFKRAGLAQASVVDRLRRYERQHGYESKHARAGGDLEGGTDYYDSHRTLSLAQGASEKAGGLYVDFGAAGGFGDTDDLCDIAWSSTRAPMPQIYHPHDARKWGDIHHACGGHKTFIGAYTARGYGAQEDHFSPREAWRHLRHASNGHIGRELADLK